MTSIWKFSYFLIISFKRLLKLQKKRGQVNNDDAKIQYVHLLPGCLFIKACHVVIDGFQQKILRWH